MSWLLYDDGVAGHHVPYLGVIDDELCRRGKAPLVASPGPPRGGATTRWIPVDSLAHRDLLGKRRQMRRVVREGLERGADTLVDLFFDKTGWVVGSTLGFGRRVYVLHHIDQLTPDARQGMGRWRARLLQELIRARLGSGVLVVHTPGAVAQMSAAFGEERVFLGRYPVAPLAQSPPDEVPRSLPRLAFAGLAREEKGLATLARAAQLLDTEVEVVILGPQSAGTRARYGPLFGDVQVRWVDTMLEIPELRRELGSATLAVLPYRDRFGDYGGSSATLLDTLAAGAPAVVSPALADQLPRGYGAVVSGDGEDPQALAAAIDRALADIARLRKEAREVGPGFIESAHSAAAYVDVLVEAAQASADLAG